MFLLGLIAFFVSLVICYSLVRWNTIHARFTADVPGSGRQKHHRVAVPRVGGIGILAGCLASMVVADLSSSTPLSLYWFFIIAVAPAFLGGLTEDLTKKVGPLPRLLLTMASAAIAFFALDAQLTTIGVPQLDRYMAFWGISFIFTLVAVGGVAHSVNIIDGFNGLASGVSVIATLGLAAIAYRCGDAFVFNVASITAAATVGFMCVNYPRGSIFLGDGGAYLLGTIAALLGVLLVVRNPHISPWAPLLMLLHPILETLYSAYRRVLIQKRSASSPDQLHLHSLVHQRLMAKLIHGRTARNASTVMPFWAGSTMIVIVAVYAAESTTTLMLTALIASGGYLWIYRRIVRFQIVKGALKHKTEGRTMTTSTAVE